MDAPGGFVNRHQIGDIDLLERYAPRFLLAELLNNGSEKPASPGSFDGLILFVDIVDSTGITDHFARLGGDGAERLAVILNRYFGKVIELVDAHGGDTIRIDGDAVIAMWRCTGPAEIVTSAAAAAVSLQRELVGWQLAENLVLRQRITLVCGQIQVILLSISRDRSFVVVAGEPISELADPHLRGEPDQITVSHAVAKRLGSVATLVRASCGSFELSELKTVGPSVQPTVNHHAEAPPAVIEGLEGLLRPFLPRVLVDRIAAGQADWLAEFRTLSVVDIKLVGLHATAPDVVHRMESVVRMIDRIVAPLGISITNVSASEKGFIVQLACGLPPFAQEHNALIAVDAAARIHPALASIGIITAIGVATGSAFCGDVGSAARREYLSTGSVMVYAARLMQIAENGILCDGATASAALGHFRFSDPEFVQVKGRAEPLAVHRIEDYLQSHKRILGVPGVIFGRQDELGLLSERLRRLPEVGGGLAVIEGEPGAGKSHLLVHAAVAARASGYRLVTSVTSPIEQSTPYYVFREILPQLLLRPDDPPDPTVRFMRARLLELFGDANLVAKAALLEDILPLELEDKGLAPEIRGAARVAGIEDLLVHIAAAYAVDAPAVILLDDLQWLDASSANLLGAMVRRVPRLLAIVATRSIDETTSTHAKLLHAAGSPVVRLPRLKRSAVKDLVSERLAVAHVPALLVDFIYNRSEGLPFFAEQLLFALRDEGFLEVAGGRCTVSALGLSMFGAPASLHGLIVSRVDRLPASHQLTLKVASVIGRVFEIDMMRQIHPLIPGQPPLEVIVDQLSASGFLSPVPGAKGREYAFRHLIIQGVTYDLLTYAQRRPLHKRIARYLEDAYKNALDPHFAALADHWERAEVPDVAISYCIRAADIAAQRYANEDALNHLDRAERLVTASKVVLRPPALMQSTRIRADACQELTRFPEANAHFKSLARLHAIPLPATRARQIAGVAVEAFLQALRRLGLVRSQSSGMRRERDRLAAHIHMRFAEYAYFTNNTLGLAYATLASLNRAERAGSLPEVINASGGLALGLATVGLLHWARIYRDRSIGLATTTGSVSARGFAELLACVQSFHTADWEGMRMHGALGAEIWQRLGDHYRFHCCRVLDGYRLIATGHYDEAEQTLLAFGEQAEDIESVQVRAWAFAARALLDVLRGRPGQALARLSMASLAGDLNAAERLLCDGIAASAHLEASDYVGALRAAEAGLDNLLASSPAMAGALLFSVPSIVEVLLALVDRPAAAGRTREELLVRARVACEAARKVAERSLVCRPRMALLRGRLAAVLGRPRQSYAWYRKALAEAQRLGQPLEEAMSHVALAAHPGQVRDREFHIAQASKIFQHLGAVWSPWAAFHDTERCASRADAELVRH